MTNKQIVEKIEQTKFLEKKVNNLIEKSKKVLDKQNRHSIIVYESYNKAVNY
jgi:hypothetical protein